MTQNGLGSLSLSLCRMLNTMSLSDVLGYASIACWLGAQFPQVVENITRQSCEGLALPFLANWLLGDISNLVGCILTHQLPFQKWLATYFVCVDFMLVVQYAYYYKPPKGPASAFGRIRSATSPAAIRRMSIDRGASRYRALSVAASNVAAAAALAAQQDETPDPRRSHNRLARKTSRRRGLDGSVTRAQGMDEGDEYHEEDLPPSMLDSFHSEGGRDHKSKRVSWSIERHGPRASSVGRSNRPTTPTVLDVISNESVPHVMSPTSNERDAPLYHDHPVLDSALPQGSNTRSSRASRKGSTMVFLGVWALFGIGALANGRRGLPSQKLTNIGSVLSTHISPVYNNPPTPVLFQNDAIFPRQGIDDDQVTALELTYLEQDPEDVPHEDPSSQQILGRVFAWLCTTLYLTSRLPQIWKNFTRKSVEGLSMYLFVFAFLGNVFYVASIIASPRRYLPPPESTKYIKESIPYLLGSGGTLMFDITIVAQSFCYRPRHRRHSSMSHNRLLDEEEAGLLSADTVSEHPPSDSTFVNRGRPSRSHSAS